MIEYWNENWPIMLDDVQQHATMVLSSLVLALVIAVIIILLFLRREKWLNSLIYFFRSYIRFQVLHFLPYSYQFLG